MFRIHLLCSLLFFLCRGISIGKIQNSRFTSYNGLNKDNIWLENQSSIEHCLCTISRHYNNVLLFNYFLNGSCELFLSLPLAYQKERQINSTIVLLSPLPPPDQTPCCSNMTWLMSRIMDSYSSSIGASSPGYPTFDDYGYLAFVSENDKFYRYNQTRLTFGTPKAIPNNCRTLTYYNKQYFVGCGSNNISMLYVLSSDNLTSIKNISVPSTPGNVAFVLSGSVMIVALTDQGQLAFYNVSSPMQYTFLYLLQAPFQDFNIYRVNDTLLYVAPYLSIGYPLYTVRYDEKIKNWTWSILNATKPPSAFANAQSNFDICGRLWIGIYRYGLRIYDSTATQLLYDQYISVSFGEFALATNFDFYTTDTTSSRIRSYQPNIDQCTS